MHAIRASARYSRAIHAVAELLGKLKIDASMLDLLKLRSLL